MIQPDMNFGKIFRRLRLRSGFATLSEFCNALAEKGFNYEESLFSHWQRGTRIPKNRRLLLSILRLFVERGGVTSIKEMNLLLESVRQGYLTDKEIIEVTRTSTRGDEVGSPKKLLDFFYQTIKSKDIKRKGWVRERIRNPESVAEHSFQLSVIAMILADHLGVDRERLIKMAIVHDLGEVITGDIIWSRGKILNIEARQKKEEDELKGLTKIFKIIDKSKEFTDIFQEMIERKSLEAKVFWQLDKLEMAIQALKYEKEQSKKLDEFFTNALLQIHAPQLKKILSEIMKRRPRIGRGGGT